MSETDALARFDRAAAAAGTVIAGVKPEQLSDATPCSEWDVRQVLNHLVGGMAFFHSMVTGGPPIDRAADYLGDDPAGAFEAGVTRLRAAFAEPGALERVIATPFGEQPGRMLVGMRVIETLLHGWDVAKATGQSTDLDPELAQECIGQFRAGRASGRGAGMFADEQPVPPGAPPADQLAAVAGRAVG